MGISILGIVVVQLVWMNNAIRVKNELFSRSVNEAMNNTVEKLEDIHNFGVLNQMVFDDSLHWKAPAMPPLPNGPQHFHPPKNPPKPVRIIREISPGKGKSKIEIKIDTSVNNGQAYTYNYSDEKDEDSGQIVINGNSSQNQIFVVKDDTIITDVDSLYSAGLIKIDSLLTNLDTFQVFQPNISKRAKIKAGNLKRMASQVVTEIGLWDVQEVDKNLIRSVLSKELQNRNIPIDFEFGIIRDSTIDLEPGATDSLKLAATNYQVELYPNNIFQKNIKLAVFFPNRQGFVYRSLNWLLMASFLFSLFILVTFSLSIFYILRQKKIAEIKSDFINNMTHEFKTPIATISVAADSITNEKVVHDPERIKYFAGMIKKENARMNLQVEDILTIARLDRKEFEFYWEKTNVHELIEDAVQGIALQVEKREGNIDLELKAQNSVVTTDKKHCTNLIYNLLDNALKYSDAAPQIKITTINKAKGILISVEDNGIGMTKNVQNKIFEKFYRQTSGNVHNVKGFGLGLSYVKAVLDANRGTIGVHSEAGVGSKFDVFLPYVRE